MRWTAAVSGIGILGGAAYTGYAITGAHTPIWAGAGTFLFLIALVVPVVTEYGSLDKGFKDMEGDFLDQRRREKGMGPAVEIIPSSAPKPTVYRPSSRSRMLTFALMVTAGGLIFYDVIERQSTLPPKPETPGLITNF